MERRRTFWTVSLGHSGGGHYAPRANKLGSMQGIWIGHMLATYALPFIKPESEGEIPEEHGSKQSMLH